MITLAALATRFLERPGLANSTLRSYESTMIPLLKQYGRWSIEIIDRQVLVEYLNHLTDVSYTTHHRHQAVITALFNFAVSTGYIKSNPMAKLSLRKPEAAKREHLPDEPAHYLTSEQLKTLYHLVSSHPRLNAIVHLLHRTGARIGELLALDLDGVDWGNRKFQVIGKGNRQRWCFYSQDAEYSLSRYVQYYRYSSCEALFTAQHPLTKEVTRISYQTVYRDWTSLTHQSSLLKETRLHDLRHTFATERVGLMGIEELRALLGHQNIQTTLRYQKVTSARAEEVAQKALKVLTKS